MTRYQRYPLVGQYRKAIEEALEVMPSKPHGCGCAGCEWEQDETRFILRAALGLLVPREKCSHCGTLDSIWAENSGPMLCHECGKEVVEHEWVEEPMAASEEFE